MTMEKVKLGDLVTFQRGFDITKKEQVDGGIPVISSGGTSSYHNICKAGGPGVVIGRKGTLGSVFYSEGDYWPHSTALWIKDFKSNNPRFIYYYLKTLKLERFDAGAANPSLNRNHIHSLNVWVPELKSRTKIADILSTYDELIDNNNQRINLLEQMAEEIYKEWFVRLRFPGHKQTRIVEGVPDGWEKVCVQAFGKVVTGKTPSTVVADNFNGGIPFIKTPDMAQGIFTITTGETLSRKGASGQKNQFISENSICVSCIGTAGEIVITTSTSQTNQQINSIILTDNIYREFVYFSMKNMKQIIEAYGATGATMTNLSKGKFESLKLIQPEKKLCRHFHTIASDIFDEILILSKKNKILKQTRDLLLPRLMSGKLSVEHLLITNN